MEISNDKQTRTQLLQGSANREKYKNKSHLFLSTRWISTKTHDETPQKLQIKRIKNYK